MQETYRPAWPSLGDTPILSGGGYLGPETGVPVGCDLRLGHGPFGPEKGVDPPPPVDKQTEKTIFPHTSYAEGKYTTNVDFHFCSVAEI